MGWMAYLVYIALEATPDTVLAFAVATGCVPIIMHCSHPVRIASIVMCIAYIAGATMQQLCACIAAYTSAGLIHQS